MHLQRKRQGRDQIMRKKIVQQRIGAVLASMVLVTFPAALVGAQMASAMQENIQHNETSSFTVKELADQGIDLEQLHIELQSMFGSVHPEIQKRGQSSLCLRDFYENSLFSCRGLA